MSEPISIEKQVNQLGAKVKALRRERSENEAVLEGVRRRLERLRSGRREDARAHIRHAAEPVPPAEMRFSRAAELWPR